MKCPCRGCPLLEGHVPTVFHSLCSKLLENVVPGTLKLVENRFEEQLVDFDSHLDNVRLDWTNSDINRALPSGGAS